MTLKRYPLPLPRLCQYGDVVSLPSIVEKMGVSVPPVSVAAAALLAALGNVYCDPRQSKCQQRRSARLRPARYNDAPATGNPGGGCRCPRR